MGKTVYISFNIQVEYLKILHKLSEKFNIAKSVFVVNTLISHLNTPEVSKLLDPVESVEAKGGAKKDFKDVKSSQNMHKVSVRMSPVVVKRLDHLSKKVNVTRSLYIRTVLIEYLSSLKLN